MALAAPAANAIFIEIKIGWLTVGMNARDWPAIHNHRGFTAV
jgi:hypothetical protein